jgi:hypothetical protein
MAITYADKGNEIRRLDVQRTEHGGNEGYYYTNTNNVAAGAYSAYSSSVSTLGPWRSPLGDSGLLGTPIHRIFADYVVESSQAGFTVEIETEFEFRTVWINIATVVIAAPAMNAAGGGYRIFGNSVRMRVRNDAANPANIYFEIKGRSI